MFITEKSYVTSHAFNTDLILYATYSAFISTVFLSLWFISLARSLDEGWAAKRMWSNHEYTSVEWISEREMLIVVIWRHLVTRHSQGKAAGGVRERRARVRWVIVGKALLAAASRQWRRWRLGAALSCVMCFVLLCGALSSLLALSTALPSFRPAPPACLTDPLVHFRSSPNLTYITPTLTDVRLTTLSCSVNTT